MIADVKGLSISNAYYYICTEIYCKMNMSNKNDALQSTRNLIGCTIFLTSEKYRMTNHNPHLRRKTDIIILVYYD